MNTKIILASAISVIGAAALLVGCDTFGSNPTLPTSLERSIFDVQTNLVPKVVTVTNLVSQTNTVTLTNTVDQTVVTTNVVTQTPVVEKETNQVEAYTLTPKPVVKEEVQTGGAVANTAWPGAGSIASMAILALLGAWGHLRSYKLSNTAATATATSSALTDEIEAIRDFILTLPQGVKIDAAVTKFMQDHQVEAGVAQTVLGLIQGNSSNTTITGLSAELQQLITAATKAS